MFKLAVLVALAVFAGASSADPVRPNATGVHADAAVDNDRERHGVAYHFYVDASARNGKLESDPAAWLKKISVHDLKLGGGKSLLAYLLQGDGEHLLKIDPEASAQKGLTNVSAVPLPTAFWLFGSALFGFVSLSNRRKV